MKQTIIDPNGSDRRGLVGIGIAFMFIGLIFLVIDVIMLMVAIVVFGSGLVIIGMGLFGRPYVMLDASGVTYRIIFRKKTCSWNDVVQIGIRNIKEYRCPVEYLFPVIIQIPNRSKWPIPLLRDMFSSILLPNRQEIRRFIEENYGSLDFNEINDLNDWEKCYYGFQDL